MKQFYAVCLLCLCVIWSGNTVEAQGVGSVKTQKKLEANVEVSYAEKVGTTPAIRDLIDRSATDKSKKQLAKKNKKEPKDFVGRGRNTIVRPELEHQGPDAVRQTSFDANLATPVEPLLNFEGLSTGSAPNDPSGDIGRDHYVQAVNATTIGVYDKEGNLLDAFNANTLWGELNLSSAGDPIILYDQSRDKWLITEFPPNNNLLVAVSHTSDPLGEWDVYNFSTPSFPDYPKYGVWNNVISVTTNEGGPGSLPCYLIDKEALMTGAASVPIQRIILPGNNNTEAGFFVATPLDWTGFNEPVDGPTFLVLNDSSWGQVDEDQVEIYSVDVDFDTPSNTSFDVTSVVLSPYDGYPCSAGGAGFFPCVPQQGGGGLDAIPEVIMNQAHYRNFGSHESMVFNFITDVTDGDNLSGIRWVELRRTSGGDWSLRQEGTLALDDGLDRFMGGICMDGAGNIGLAYNVTSPNSYVGVRFTGRRAGDPLGEMTIDEYVVVEGSNTINSGSRFGDYAHMSVDPTNDRTFWYTTEYAGSGGVDTRILAFELRRDTIDIGVASVISPQSADDLTDSETVSFEVENYGLETQESFEVGYIFENGTAVTETVNTAIAPGQTYTHTFTPTVNMDEIKDYEFKFFTALEDDQAYLNDTLRAVISKLPRWDASISVINGLSDVSCGPAKVIDLVLTNYGTQTLNSIVVEVLLNGTSFKTIDWTGELPSGESVNIPLTVTGLNDGGNTIVASCFLPNGNFDENTANDSVLRSFEAIINSVAVFFNLNTDDYPEETTWELTNEQGQVINSGGPYASANSTFVEELCLDADECYTFTIFDTFGDGICCGVGQGNYSFTDALGEELLFSNGNFSTIEENDFCAEFACFLTADFAVTATSEDTSEDGSILVNDENGSDPVQYSIDGGQSYQDSPLFDGLAEGDYEIMVLDANDCTYESTVTIEACKLAYVVDLVNETFTGAEDGSLTINVFAGNEPYVYSIDNGVTFQSSNVFEGLESGEYDIVVEDDLDCSVAEMAALDITSYNGSIATEHFIEIFPNPTDGVFRINVSGLEQSSVFLYLEIYDLTGKRIQRTNLTRYNDTFTGQVSLFDYPSGTYFVRFLNDDIDRMLKVFKN